MRIAQVIPGLAVASGPTTFCVKVCEELAKAGCAIDLYVAQLGENVLLPQEKGVRVIEFGKTLQPVERPDLIHIHALWVMASHRGCVYARRSNISYVVSAHGMLAPWALRHKWLKKKIAWWLYQKRDLEGASMFHVTAESEIKWLRDLGFSQPCVLAPLGSSLPELSPAKVLKRQDVKTVLFVGRVYPVKGLMNLVRAWAQVRSSKVRECESSKVGGEANENGLVAGNSRTSEQQNIRTFPWQLVIAGPDQAGHKIELVGEARRLGLNVEDATTQQLIGQPALRSSPPDIIFTGAVYGADKDALYRMADLFVLPSFTENFGVVVTDALSYGVPVITTKGTPWAELLGHSAGSKVLTCESSKVGETEDGGRRQAAIGSRQSAIGDEESANDANNINLRTSELKNFRTSTGRCGWWVDIGVKPLEEALQAAMSLTDEARQSMGENGRQLVEMKYTWPAIAAAMNKAYKSLLCR